VQSITFPNGLIYQFSYDGSVHSDGTKTWGQMSSVSLPSGASVSYIYPSQPTLSPSYQPTVTQIFPLSSKSLEWTDEDSGPGLSRQELSSYSFTGSYSVITNPDGGQLKRYFFSPQGILAPQGMTGLWLCFRGLVYKTESYDAGQALTGTSEQVWTLNPPYATDSSIVSFHVPGNPVTLTQLQSAVNNGSRVLGAAKSFLYDRNGNQTQISETDWVPYGNVTHDSNSVPTGISGAPTLRSTMNTFVNGTTTAAAGNIDDPNGYWNSRTVQLLNLVARSTVTGAGFGSVTEVQYDNGALSHGNLTKEIQWDSELGVATNPLTSCPQVTAAPTGCNASVVTHTYDGYGNLTSTTDPRGNTTQLTYDSAGLCIIAKTLGSGARHFTYTPCDQSTDVTTSETDTDHGIRRAYGYDEFGRNTSVQESGGGITRYYQTIYNDSSRQIVHKSDLNISQDGALISTAWYDQLGRVRQTQDASNNLVQTRYYTPPPGQTGAGANYKLVSNPYLTGNEPSVGWTLTTTDTVGRVTSTQNCAQGPSTLPAPWSGTTCAGTGTAIIIYGATTGSLSASTSVTTDEAGVSRTSSSDGLGRLIQVTENGTENTTYAYDAMDDLVGVTEPGVQGRSFSYSSLKRLLSASNPESGLACYTYDLNGNLQTRTQGGSGSTCPESGGVTVTYGPYDPLNQLGGKTYSDSTPTVSYSYTFDWLTTVTAGNVVNRNLTFDGLGRVTSSSQTIPGVSGSPWTLPQYQYDLNDDLAAITLPSGRVVSTTYDSVGRAVSVQGGLGTSKPYDSSITYSPHGAIIGEKLGNGLWQSTSFNSRLQRTIMTLGSSLATSDVWGLSNVFSPTNNNGNILSQNLTVPGMSTVTTAYGYDGLNRLSVAAENSSNPASPPCPDSSSQWCRGYSYYAGGHGNRQTAASTGQGISPLEPGGFNTNNQIADTGWSYTEANNVQRGNVAQQKGGATFAYDAENRQTAYCPNDANPANCTQTAGNGRTLYFYDGNGQRVMTQTADGTVTAFVYDASGNLSAEYASVMATPLCATCYMTTDHLGSTRVLTDPSGCPVFRADYLPFGETILALSGSARLNATGGTLCPTNGYQASTTPRLMFTGKERDAETGLDYFGARHFSGAQGRFTSPDEAFADQQQPDPQSWNLYAYARNNPLRFIDPNGQAVEVCTNEENGKIKCVFMLDRAYAQARAGNNPGIVAPAAGVGAGPGGGLAFGGLITCGGSVCGSATYHEEAMQEDAFAEGLLLGSGRGILSLFESGGNDLAGSIRNVNPKGGTTNCVNCSIASDATLKGSPASAMPGGITSISELTARYGGQFVKVEGKRAIDQAMEAAGPGSHGIVYAERAGGVGHVFNAVNQGGVVRYLDGQTGQVASFAGYTGFRLLRTD